MPLFTLTRVIPNLYSVIFMLNTNIIQYIFEESSRHFFFTITVHTDAHLSRTKITINEPQQRSMCTVNQVMWCLVWRIDQNVFFPLKISRLLQLSNLIPYSEYSNCHVAFGYDNTQNGTMKAKCTSTQCTHKDIIWPQKTCNMAYFSNVMPLGVLGKLSGIFRAFLSHC